jgi:hypothetical protein
MKTRSQTRKEKEKEQILYPKNEENVLFKKKNISHKIDHFDEIFNYKYIDSLGNEQTEQIILFQNKYISLKINRLVAFLSFYQIKSDGKQVDIKKQVYLIHYKLFGLIVLTFFLFILYILL